MSEKPKILVVAGPTAVGKTALSIQLAKEMNGEVISGDSMQVYRGLDIGTAKVTQEEMNGVPHHLIDIRDIAEGFSAAAFKEEAKKAIAEIIKRGKLPIVAGGTGLYLQSLLEDFQLGGTQETSKSHQLVREKWQQYVSDFGQEALYQKLWEIDAKAAEKISSKNTKRMIRALEVYQLTGKSITDQLDSEKNGPYSAKLIGLTTDRQLLYQRINQRVDQMMDNGLLKEAQMVANFPDSQGIKAIGYKEFLPYFQGVMTLEQATEQVKINSRRYAKRQLTWFRNRMDMSWWDLIQFPHNIEEIRHIVLSWKEEDA